MNSTESDYSSVDKVIALWAFTEAFFAGILHLFKMPFTGLFISNLAVLYITLISYFANKRGSILRATIIVIVFKFLISPYTPVMAYLAVFYQGLLGEVFYSFKKFRTFFCFLFAIVVAFLTSAQKIITTTILFGMTLWESIDKFYLYVSSELFLNDKSGTITNFSFYLISFYIVIHLIAGFLAAIFIVRFTKSLAELMKNPDYRLNIIIKEKSTLRDIKSKKKNIKPFAVVLFIFIGSIIFLSYYNPEKIGIGRDSILIMFIRAFLIILIWYKFISPVIIKILTKQIERKSIKYSDKISMLVKFEPYARSMIPVAWNKSSIYRGLKRLSYFIKLSLVNFLAYSPN